MIKEEAVDTSAIRQSSRHVKTIEAQDQEQHQEDPNKKQAKKKDVALVKILKKSPVPEYDIANVSFPVIKISVAEIRKALKTKSVPDVSKRQLVLIPNINERSKIYIESAVAIADREARALPSHGGRNWTCNVVISDTDGASGEGVNSNHGSLEQGRRSLSASTAFASSGKRSKGGGQKRKKNEFGPLFRWYRGMLELACLPHLLEKINVLDDGVPSTIKNSMEPLISYKKSDLQEREITLISSWAWENPSYPTPLLKRRWLSPDHVIFNSRSSALHHAAELIRRDKLIDRILFGFGSRGVELRPLKPTKKESLEAGYYRFLRDGLWVIGQEEDWLDDRLQKWNSAVTKNVEVDTKSETPSLDVAPFDDCELIADASNEKIHIINMLGDSIHVGAMNPIKDESNGPEFESSTLSSQQAKVCDGHNQQLLPSLASVTNSETAVSIHSISVDASTGEFKTHLNLDLQEAPSNNAHDLNPDEVKMSGENLLRMGSFSAIPVIPLDVGSEHSSTRDALLLPIENKRKDNMDMSVSYPLLSTNEDCCDEIPSMLSSSIVITRNEEEKSRRPRTRAIKSIVPSNHWRLTPDEIDSCSEAIQGFFLRVMHTIKMKQLHSELADGYDIIRERGRGRYDMQIPSFDDAKFNFLNDLQKARWMPVIRQILGDDATLVHKGCFLSLPGSDAQVYHQDGPHLTTKYQRPCHAVNVFVPLVDLHEKNGPTEFCLGTHILGYEYYSKEMIYTPIVKAGTPIIFDYRLGHRGLGNSSESPRPIVYLTYTSASKEFRDQINFSRKRYKKFGEILDLPISREERARKRSKVDVDTIEVGLQCPVQLH